MRFINYIINLGVTSALSKVKIIRLRSLNIITFVMLVLSTAVTVVLVLFNYRLESYPPIAAIIGTLFILFLNRLGFYRTAIATGVTLLSIYAALYVLYYGLDSGLQYLIFAMLPLPYLALGRSEGMLVILSGALMSVILLAVHIYPLFYEPLIRLDGQTLNIIRIASYVFSALVLLGAVYLFVYSFSAVEKRMTEKIDNVIRQQRSQVRRALDELKNTGSDLGGIKDPLADGHESMSRFAQKQITSVEEIQAAIEEISASVDSVATSTQREVREIHDMLNEARNFIRKSAETKNHFLEAADLVQKSTNLGKTGETSINSMVDGMTYMVETTDEMKKVAEIINDIADRINLLSLNASIEAARAGSAGRGFAVVANEISKLAQQTGESTSNINFLIETTTQIMTTYTRELKGNAKNLRMLIEGINQVNNIFTEISRAVSGEEQMLMRMRDNFDLVKEYISGIENSTQDQKTSIADIARTIHDLNAANQSNISVTEKLGSAITKAHTMIDAISQQVTKIEEDVLT